MTNSIEKIVVKMKRARHGHSFGDCQKVLESKGYKVEAGKGSHFKFFKEGKDMIVIAKHRPVSPQAINDVLRAWED